MKGVVDLKGTVLHGLGDPRHVIFARSSTKPLQAIPVVESGAADRYDFSQAVLSTYREIGHPVQLRMRAAVAEMTDMPQEDIAIGVDGCGVPVFGVPLDRLALSFAKLSGPSGLPNLRRRTIRRVASAKMTHPEMVGGKDRFCTDLMSALPGRIARKASMRQV